MNSDDELDDADLQAEIELDDADLQAEIERLQNEVAEPYDDLDSGDNGYEDTPLSVLQVHKVDFANGKKDTELRKELRRKNEEIAELKSMLSMGKGTVEAVKEQKYLEALKKVKQMTVKLEKEKNSNNKLTRQLVSMEKQLLDVQNLNILPSAGALVSELASVMPGSDEDMQRQFKEAKQKVEKANKVIEHMRRQNQDMTMELKRTKQVLAKEVGEENVDKAVDEGSGWRGRAQQISLLKAKVKQLQRAKGAAASGEDGSVIDDDMSDNRSAYTSYTGYTAVTGTTRKDHNDVHQHKLEQKHANRAKEVADLQIILANKEKELKEAKENAHALQARTINLEKYGQDLKLKLHRVIEKTENDDKLIEMYKQELANSKKCMTPPPRPKSRTPPSLMDAEAEELVQSLRAELASTKQKLMDALYSQISTAASKPLDEGSEDSSVVLRMNFAEVEAEKLRELVQLLKGQLNAEMENHATTSGHLRAERQKSASIERTLAKGKGTIDVQPKPGVEDKLQMLKDENRSLKEQLLRVHEAHAHELGTYKTMLDKLKAVLGTGPKLLSRGAGGDSGGEELQDLRKQYNELRSAYNAMAMKQSKG